MRWILVLIPLSFLALLLVWPMLEIIRVALVDAKGSPWELIAHVVSHPLYRTSLENTIRISASVTLITLIAGYPVAYIATHASTGFERIVLLGVATSMWISILIRSYAWIVILQRNGPISELLQIVGIIPRPTSFLFTKWTVVLGMSHILLPFMILSIWASVTHHARQSRQIAFSLGATPFYYICRVFMPNSLPGAAAGSILVFLLSMGFYITPELLGGGGGDTMMLGVLVSEQINRFGDWATGATIATFLLVVLLLLSGLLFMMPGIRRIGKAGV